MASCYVGYIGRFYAGKGAVDYDLDKQQGFVKKAFLTEAMEQERIELDGVEGIIDTVEEAHIADDTVREHRHGIAPTYGDLLGEGRFNPAEAKQLTYAQALNLENYLYLAVVAFGLVQSVIASGVFMVITGIALGGTGLVLYRLSGRLP